MIIAMYIDIFLFLSKKSSSNDQSLLIPYDSRPSHLSIIIFGIMYPPSLSRPILLRLFILIGEDFLRSASDS